MKGSSSNRIENIYFDENDNKNNSSKHYLNESRFDSEVCVQFKE